MDSQWSNTPDSCPHTNAGDFYTLFESDAIFLIDGKNVDGKNVVRYRDLPGIIRSADYHLKRALSGNLQKGDMGSSSERRSSPDTESNPATWIGIDTTHRFDAILWMVYCWFRSIPFVPFSTAFTEPVTRFRPDVLILTSPDTRTHPEIRRVSSDEGEVYGTRIFQAPALLSNRPSEPSPDPSSGLPPDPSSDPSPDPSSDMSSGRYHQKSPDPSSDPPPCPSPSLTEGRDYQTDRPHLPVSRFPGLHGQPDRFFCGLTTSGSSGRPKRVALLRSNMIAATENALRNTRFPGNKSREPEGNPSHSTRNVMAPRDTVTSLSTNASRNKTTPRSTGTSGNTTKIRDEVLWGNCLPLYHTGGLTIIFRALLSGTGIYLWDTFEPGTVTSDIQNHPGIRRVSLVPTMLRRLMDFSAEHKITPPETLEQVLLGGGPASADLFVKARKAGWPVCFSYGMTETCGQIASQNQDGSDPAGSVGRLFPGHELSIRNEHGNEVATGSTGLLRIRGPQVFPGYFSHDRQILSSKAGPDRDGWFETGDFARQDSHGHLFIEARRTDLIISGGENVNPVDVEAALSDCPLVSEAAVTGVPDEEWGQIVIAFVVPQQSELLSKMEIVTSGSGVKKQEDITKRAAQTVRQFAEKNLRPAQRPKRVYFVSALPRTSIGKINRTLLQNMATGLPS